MHIAFVSEHASPLAEFGGPDAGGQNVHVDALARALVAGGDRVTVFTRRDDPRLPDRVHAPGGYDVVHVPAGPPCRIPKDDIYPHVPDLADVLEYEFARDVPDVVHAHFWMSGLAAVLAAHAARVPIPVVVTFHALGIVKRAFLGDADTSPPGRVAIETVVARHAAAVAATCTDEVFTLARMGLPAGRSTVIPCGVDLTAFTGADPTSVNVAPRTRRHRIVSVGRLVPRKGFEVAVRALPDIPDTELLLVGGPADGDVADDPEAHRLDRIAAELGVADRVHLLGKLPREAMPEVLASADLVACVPWYEPFGIVPLEAMASGTPVVATAVGGLTDTVIDGVTGTLVPPRDPAALAGAARALLDDPAQRSRYAAAGRRRVHERYSWARVAAETRHLYIDVVGRQVRPGAADRRTSHG
ncbi:MAG: glycosyltransferase [Gordonia paraffinivorans]